MQGLSFPRGTLARYSISALGTLDFVVRHGDSYPDLNGLIIVDK